MQWWQAGLWGALGSALVEIADLNQSIRTRKEVPWKGPEAASPGLYLLAAALRMALGVGIAMALGQIGQISGATGGLLSGIAAPKILESLRHQAETGSSTTTPEPATRTPQEIAPTAAEKKEEVSHDIL